LLARRSDVPREEAAGSFEREAASLLGVPFRSLRGWRAGERIAWRRWAPLVVVLPGVAGWPPEDHEALVAVIRAKGGRRESDFVGAFDLHVPLRKAMRRLIGASR
jgi:hypothetical protein